MWRVKGIFPACATSFAADFVHMYIAWTAVATLPEAESLGSTAVTRLLAACVQIEGPVIALRLAGKT